MKKYFFLLLFFLISTTLVFAQDSLYARKIIQTLTSKEYNGRGYVQNGDRHAADYLREQFSILHLTPLTKNYFQSFNFPVNTFPDCMRIRLDEKELIPGKDFIINPESASLKGTYRIRVVNQPPFIYSDENFSDAIIVIDTSGYPGKYDAISMSKWENNPLHAKGIIRIQEKKLTWSVSSDVASYFGAQLLRSSFPEKAKMITVDVCNKFIKSHETQNIIGKIEGTTKRDSFIFITAHYDHLGMMGSKCYFPGANDNASGVSMLLNLAKYFSSPEHRSAYTIVFICFAGEEAGLLGSKYYTEHPVLPLSSIRFLINLDLLGTGDEGLMVVNATIYNDEFSLLNTINNEHHYLSTIGKRGKAHNSDHYYFTEKNVPSFFCYTLGGITAYHDIYDVESTLPLTKYKETFKLLSTFVEQLGN